MNPSLLLHIVWFFSFCERFFQSVTGGTCQWSYSIFGPIAISRCGWFESMDNRLFDSIYDTCDKSDINGNPTTLLFTSTTKCDGIPSIYQSSGNCNAPITGCTVVQVTLEYYDNYDCKGEPVADGIEYFTDGGHLECANIYQTHSSHFYEIYLDNPNEYSIIVTEYENNLNCQDENENENNINILSEIRPGCVNQRWPLSIWSTFKIIEKGDQIDDTNTITDTTELYTDEPTVEPTEEPTIAPNNGIVESRDDGIWLPTL